MSEIVTEAGTKQKDTINEHSERLSRFMGKLPNVNCTVLTLVGWCKFQCVEAAQMLKASVGTVKSQLAHARFRISKT